MNIIKFANSTTGKDDGVAFTSSNKVTIQRAPAQDSHQPATAVRLRAKSLVMLQALVCLGIFAPKMGFSEGPCPGGPLDPLLLPMPPGTLVATCFSGYNVPFDPTSGLRDDFTVAIMDVRTPFLPIFNPPIGPKGFGLNWCAPKYHNDNAPAFNQWRSASIGQVFGVTLDNQNPPNIYVTPATVYGPVTTNGIYGPNGFIGGAPGGGQIYRLDGTNGVVSNFARLSDPLNGGAPNSGTGLGNICYDPIHRQFFVTNFDNGLIYRLPLSQPNGNNWTGTTWDHGVNRPFATNVPPLNLVPIPDTPATDFTGLGRRVWAVQVIGNRLYYSTWGRDFGRTNGNPDFPGTVNEVWSIALDPVTGDFSGFAKREFVLPATPQNPVSLSPVSSIAFSPSGTMFVAERVRYGDIGLGNSSDAHRAEVLEYVNSSGTWSPSSRNFYVGNIDIHTNSAGGVDLDNNGDVWQSGDALVFGTNHRPPSLPPDPGATLVYGVQKTPAAGNSNDDVNFPPDYVGLSSIYIDLDGLSNTNNKTQIGGVSVYRSTGEPGTSEQCCGEKPHFTDPDYANVFTGQVAVNTYFAPSDTEYVLSVRDLKNQATAPLGTNYDPPVYHGSVLWPWTLHNLGEIFGVTLDDSGSIYVTATTAYRTDIYPAGATRGEIYRIDGVTGVIATFARLPQTAAGDRDNCDITDTGAAGLGNIAYDCAHRNFYVSNMDDGLIYRLDHLTGNTLSTWDHGLNLPTAHPSGTPFADDTSMVFTQLGRRVWGLQPHNGRLYYGVWWEDDGRPNPVHANEVWSIALNSSGDFVPGTDQLEITMPVVVFNGQNNYSNPVSDISFGPAGTMLLTERSMVCDSDPDAHQSRALEYTFYLGTWTLLDPTKFVVGAGDPAIYPGSSAGGGDYDFSAGGRVWVTGDALCCLVGSDNVYGIQGLPATGGDPSTSILIDSNGDVSVSDKTEIGDVEIPCPDCEVNGTVITPSTVGGPYTYQFTVTNHTNQAVSTIVLHPVSGVTSITHDTFHISPPLQPGQTSQVYTVTLDGVQPGVQACFDVILVATSGATCCSRELCVPIQSCFEVVQQSVQCLPNNMARLTITIKNLETYTLYYAEVIPWDPNKTATPVTLDPPVPPLGTATIQTTISPVGPDETVLYTLTVHFSDFETCCSRDLSFTANCEQPGPGLVSAVSRMTHGAAGDFDIPLPLDGTPAVEDRGSAPGTLTLVFTFDEEVAGGDAMVMEGTATINGQPTFSGNQMLVNLTGVANAQTIKVTVDAVDINGHMHSSQSVRVSILYGDVNGNGVVNASDIALTKSHLGEPVNATNFRSDVNKNGSINAADVAIVKSNTGTSLPP